MRIIISVFLILQCLCCIPASAQSTVKSAKRSKPIDINNMRYRWAISVNPFSVLEFQQAAVGLGVQYQLSQRLNISSELNYLYRGFWKGNVTNDGLAGFRDIISLRRFSRNEITFLGIDTRIKYYSFADKKSFINSSTNDTLFDFRHTASNTLLGFGATFGARFPFAKKKNWAVEFNTGLGVKYREVSRKNIPDGYKFYLPIEYSYKHYDFTSQQEASGWDNVYFPIAIRVLYLL